MIYELRIAEFLEDLASNRPTPGGGAAAAVVGALAAALVEMVAGLPPQNEECKLQSAKLRQRFLQLADADCRAFKQVIAAYKLPKEDRGRRFEIEKALKRATEVPAETLRLVREVEKLAAEMVEKGNKSAVSDARSAGYLAQAAQRAARENMEINLAGIEDEEWKKQILKLCGLTRMR